MKFRKTLTIALLTLPVILVIVILFAVTIHNYNSKILQIETKTKLELAIIELEARNYNNALGMFSDLIIADSQDIAAVIGINSIYQLKGEYLKSYELLSQYVGTDNPTIVKALCLTNYELKKYDEAIQYGLKSLANSSQDEASLTIVLKAINLTRNSAALTSLLDVIRIDELTNSSKFLVYITELNFGTNKIAEINDIKNKLPSQFQYVANEYEANFANVSLAESELVAKTNIAFALVNVGMWEYANIYSEDMFNINKYYENSLLFHSIININLKNYNIAIQDLESLRKHTTHDLNANVLLLEAYICSKFDDKVEEIITQMILSFDVENEPQYFEVFKVLYNYHEYELYWKFYLGVASKMHYNATEVHFMAMKIAAYRKDYLIIPLIIEQVSFADEKLNIAERASYIAAQALNSFNEGQIDKAHSLIKTAEELYFYDPFVHYVKSIIYSDMGSFNRAIELDLLYEIPIVESIQ